MNLASRICGAADGGHTLASDLVSDLGTEKGFILNQVGPRELKGFAQVTRRSSSWAPKPEA